MSAAVGARQLLLLCAGFPRSGSTWLFNVMRIALLQAKVPIYASWIEDYEAANPAPVHLVKVHDVCPLLDEADAVFVSTRDLRDVAASRRLFDPLSDDPDAVVDYFHLRLHHHGQYERRAHHHVVYEQMVADKPGHIARILAALGIDGDPDAIDRAVEALTVRDVSDDGRYDRNNLLLQNHVRHGGVGYYAEHLTPASVAMIERHFGGWLADHGYVTRTSAPAAPLGAFVLPRASSRPALVDLSMDERLCRMIRDDERGIIYYWTPKCGCVNFLANIFRSMGRIPDDALRRSTSTHLPDLVAEVRTDHLRRFPVTIDHLRSGRYRQVKLVRSSYRRIASAYFMLERQRQAIREYARNDARYREKLLYFPDLDYPTFLACLRSPYHETDYTRQVRYHCARMSHPEIDPLFEIVQLENSTDWFEAFGREHFGADGFRFDFRGIGEVLERQAYHNPTGGTATSDDALYEDAETLDLFHELYAGDVVRHGYELRQSTLAI